VQFTSLATFSFTGSDTSEWGANWDNNYTGFGAGYILTNQGASNAPNTTILESYNGITWPDDQYSQITIDAMKFCALIGVAVRAANPATLTYYAMHMSCFDGTGSTGGIEIVKSVGGSFTSLADDSVTPWANSSVLKGAVLDTDLYLFKDDVEVLSASDSAIASGRGGIYLLYFTNCSGYVDGDEFRIDNWVGGEVEADATGVPHRLLLLGVGH
jgi:hypothetical protein